MSDDPRGADDGRSHDARACDEARAAAREAAEVLVGHAVLTFQRLQVQRRDLERSMGIPAGTPLVDSLRRMAESLVGR